MTAVPADAGQPSLNPLVQAWRAFEALVVVLAAIVGVLYLLKRYGLVKTGGAAPGTPALSLPSWLGALGGPPRPQAPDGAATSGAPLLTVLRSQPLPGPPGVALHLVSVGDRTLLLGATPQSVNLLAEWETDVLAETPQETAAFADYLAKNGVAPEPTPADSVAAPVRAAADRLQSLLARRRDEDAA